MYVMSDIPSTLYKYFERAEHADALCNGNVWISTLSGWRTAEGVGRHDAGEGTLQYRSGRVVGSSGEPAFEHVVANSGIQAERCIGITFNNVGSQRSISDAYGISLTMRTTSPDVETFGTECVEIESPIAFFDAISGAVVVGSGGQSIPWFHLTVIGSKSDRQSYLGHSGEGTTVMALHVNQPKEDVVPMKNRCAVGARLATRQCTRWRIHGCSRDTYRRFALRLAGTTQASANPSRSLSVPAV